MSSENASPTYYNRYSGSLMREPVYREQWLRWAYHSSLGKLSMWAIFRRAWVSRIYGRMMDNPKSRERIAPFIEEFRLRTEDFERPPEEYATFNEFFYRRMKANRRPVNNDPRVAVFPSDGRHMGFTTVRDFNEHVLKGEAFDLPALLKDPNLFKKYRDGSMIVSRLAPMDCHRFCFPVRGKPSEARLLNGHLHAVNPIALLHQFNNVTRNKRYLTSIETRTFGTVIQLEIGATFIGSVIQTYQPGEITPKGTEKGYFAFGGSMIILLFEPGSIRLASDLLEQTANGREIYANMGDSMGVVSRPDTYLPPSARI